MHVQPLPDHRNVQFRDRILEEKVTLLSAKEAQVFSSRFSFMVGLLLFWFVNLDCLNEAFAFGECALRRREKPDSANSEALQGAAQWLQTLAGDCDETVLKSDMEGLVTRIRDKFGVLGIAVWEQVNLPRLFHAQAMRAGIRAPAGQILCPRACWCFTL